MNEHFVKTFMSSLKKIEMLCYHDTMSDKLLIINHETMTMNMS